MEILNTLLDLVLNIGTLIKQVFVLSMGHVLMIVWIAWWLWAVNWKKAWPVLARGAWAPAVLLVVVGALVWSRIAPSDFGLGFMILPNFWWQLVAVGLLAGVALFCGWLQGVMGWTPPEISLEPPVVHDAGHGGHGH